MSGDDDPITRREMDLREENLTLRFTQVVSEAIDKKFHEWEERWETSGNGKFHERVLELTGETSDNAARIRAGAQWAMKGAESEKDTRRKWRGALIGFSLPSLGAILTWLANHFPKWASG